MRFYLASSFALRGIVKDVYDLLLDEGHSVPDVWWENDMKASRGADLDGRAWGAQPEIRAVAERHWASIARSDALILVGSSMRDMPRKFTGANIEVGFAIGRGIPVFSVGYMDRSAMYSPVTQCIDHDELQRCLRVFAMQERHSTSTRPHGGEPMMDDVKCRSLCCTGEHCDTCGRDIIGGCPTKNGGRACGACPNLTKGVYDVVVRVHASSMVRAMQCVDYACAAWFPASDSNYEKPQSAAVIQSHQNGGDSL